MAREFLASHGVNLDSIMSDSDSAMESQKHLSAKPLSKVINTRLPDRPLSSRWDVSFLDGKISHIEESETVASQKVEHLANVCDAKGGLLAPSLCHAHVHLDKCFLLQDEKYNDLEISEGNFREAMSMTSTAKARMEEDDLIRRGRRLILESIDSGVTMMRAFVEVDEIVGMKCLEAGLKLKEEFEDVCEIQICAFAQLALFSGEDGGEERRILLREAIERSGVDVIGSTPYVEDSSEKMKMNIRWTISTAIQNRKFLDFHLDYNVDQQAEPLVWEVIKELKNQRWLEQATEEHQAICLGHCTRLTFFDREEWADLKQSIDNLPIHFIGLPTSDLYLMGKSLNIPQMIQRFDLNAAIALNNIANAFTPYGTCNLLNLAMFAVGVYQAGTNRDARLLYECVSNRAKAAIGSHIAPSTCQIGDQADLILFDGNADGSPRTIAAAVMQGGGRNIRTIYRGRLISS